MKMVVHTSGLYYYLGNVVKLTCILIHDKFRFFKRRYLRVKSQRVIERIKYEQFFFVHIGDCDSNF